MVSDYYGSAYLELLLDKMIENNVKDEAYGNALEVALKAREKCKQGDQDSITMLKKRKLKLSTKSS